MDTRKNELLTAAQEKTLAHKIEVSVLAAEQLLQATEELKPELEILIAEGKQAWQKLWLANLRLVGKIAGAAAAKFCLPYEELFQEGCLGLADAMLRFDYQRGVRFSTLAYVWINHKVQDCATMRGGCHDGPLHLRQLKYRLAKLTDPLSDKITKAKIAELAKTLNTSPEMVSAALSYRKTTIGDGMDIVDPNSLTIFDQAEKPSLYFLNRLEPLEREVLVRRYGIRSYPETLRQIGESLRISPATVHRIEKSALAKSRDLLVTTAAA